MLCTCFCTRLRLRLTGLWKYCVEEEFGEPLTIEGQQIKERFDVCVRWEEPITIKGREVRFFSMHT